MESDGSIALAATAQTAHTNEPHFTSGPAQEGIARPNGDGSNHHDMTANTSTPAANSGHSSAEWAAIETPVHTLNHQVESNDRSTAAFGLDQMPNYRADTAFADSTHTNGDLDGGDFADYSYVAAEEVPTTPSNEAPPTVASGAVDEPSKISAFGMLQFPDSYCYVTTMYLMLGRDMQFYRDFKTGQRAKLRAEKRQKKSEARQFRAARRAMEDYALEPSQPSQHDGQLASDDDADNGDLVGHPMPGLLSNYSQQGGIVSYVEHNEDEILRAQSRRRKNKYNSSSNHSIAPQSLHDLAEGDALRTEGYTGQEYEATDPSEWAQLPLHTPRPEGITTISKEHMLLRYSSDLERWVVDVHGRNGIWIDEVHFACGQRSIVLRHGAVLQVGDLKFTFLLPSNVVAKLQEEELELEDEDEEDDEDEVVDSVEFGSNIDTSPAARRISDTIESIPSDEEVEPTQVERPQKKKSKKSKEAKEPKKPLNKIKLVSKKGRPPVEEAEPSGKGKGKGKDKGKGKAPAKADPKAKSQDKPVTEVEKSEGKAPPAEPEVKSEIAGESTAPVAPAAPAGDAQASRPPPQLDPTSAFANVAPSQYPEKRKGPGRPPKNGLLSKRDDAGVKRRLKEYERNGQQPPDLSIVLEMVRNDQRAKDAAAKAQAKGEPPPDMPIPSIEASGMPMSGAPGPSQALGQSQPQTQGSGSPNEVQMQRAMSPRLPRRAKSPSPIKPEHEFTEEELKKPAMTYIYIIDEILQHVEGGQADLQTIYDKIQKRWPFYKYKVNSVGWQSSVRHNLLQCDRFKDVGKSGKGKYWTIDYSVELSDKKRKPTPPPRPPMPYGQQQYGQQPYGPYNQQPMNGQMPYNANGQQGPGNYASPYVPNGPYPPPPQGPLRQNSNGAYQQQAGHGNGSTRPPSQQPPPVKFNGLVMAIVTYRSSFLSSFPLPQQAEIGKDFDAKIADVENFVKAGGTAATAAGSTVDFSIEPCRTILSIFESNKKDWQTPAPQTPQPPDSATTTSDQPATQAQNGVPVPANGNSATPTPGQSGPNVQHAPQNPQQNFQGIQQNMVPQASGVAQSQAQAPPQANSGLQLQPQGIQQPPAHSGFAPNGSGAPVAVPPPQQNGVAAMSTYQIPSATPQPQFTNGLNPQPSGSATPPTLGAAAEVANAAKPVPASNTMPTATPATINGLPAQNFQVNQQAAGSGLGPLPVPSVSPSTHEKPAISPVGQAPVPFTETRPSSAGVKRKPDDLYDAQETKRIKTSPASDAVGEKNSPE